MIPSDTKIPLVSTNLWCELRPGAIPADHSWSSGRNTLEFETTQAPWRPVGHVRVESWLRRDDLYPTALGFPWLHMCVHHCTSPYLVLNKLKTVGHFPTLRSLEVYCHKKVPSDIRDPPDPISDISWRVGSRKGKQYELLESQLYFCPFWLDMSNLVSRKSHDANSNGAMISGKDLQLSELRIVSKEEEAEAIKDLPSIDPSGFASLGAAFFFSVYRRWPPCTLIRFGWLQTSSHQTAIYKAWEKQMILVLIGKPLKSRWSKIHKNPPKFGKYPDPSIRFPCICRTTNPIVWKRGSDTKLSSVFPDIRRPARFIWINLRLMNGMPPEVDLEVNRLHSKCHIGWDITHFMIVIPTSIKHLSHMPCICFP